MNHYGAVLMLNKVVPALRSGDYVQGHGVLRSEDNTWCCLGVMCNEENPEGWSEKPVSGGRFTFSESREQTLLPSDLADKLGISQWGKSAEVVAAIQIFAPQFNVPWLSAGLTALNDGVLDFSPIGNPRKLPSVDFAVIANVLEHAAVSVLSQEANV